MMCSEKTPMEYNFDRKMIHQGRIWGGEYWGYKPSPKLYAGLNYLYNNVMTIEHHSFLA